MSEISCDEWNKPELTAAFLKNEWNIYMLFVKILYNIRFALCFIFVSAYQLMKIFQVMKNFEQLFK